MQTISVSSDDVQQDWGSTVEHALSGKQVVITQPNHPSLVIVSNSMWEDIQMRLAMLDAIMEAQQVMQRPRSEGWISNRDMRERMAERGVVGRN